MDHFRFRRGELWCEGVPLARVAVAVGTPVYIYSSAALAENYRRLERGLRGVPHTICYSVKANSNLAVLRRLARLGAGFDIVSGGELYRVLRAGGRADRVVFSGVGKTSAEIDYALRRGVLFIQVESEAELAQVAARARHWRRKAQVAVRVNPDVDPHTHRHISTGRQAHKFGVDWRRAEAVCRRAAELPEVEFLGIGCHIGSQITRLAPFRQALKRLEALAAGLVRAGVPIRYLDVGGGVGIRYGKETAIPVAAYARLIKAAARRLGCHLVVEPGRVIAGAAGVLLAQVLLEKRTGGRRFVVVDAGMTDFLRPALYGAEHRIEPLNKTRGRQTQADVVGPVCETADSFARGLRLPALKPGALLAVRDAGAYGFVLASNYNARPRPAEVLVEGGRFRVIRRREAWRELVRGER